MSMQNLKTESASEKLDCGICNAKLELIAHYSFWSESEQDLYAFCVTCFNAIAGSDYHPATIIVEGQNVIG